jgi:hypothetical protein
LLVCGVASVALNDQVAVRVKDVGQERITELLNRSELTGPPVRFGSNRCDLVRAAQLGFKALEITRPSNPVVCRGECRTYV